MSKLDSSPVARAMGRIPSGLFIVTTRGKSGPTGFLGSFVMQTGFEPPTVCLAIGKSRPHLTEVRACGSFALSILDPKSRGLMAPFLRKLDAGQSPLDGLQLGETPAGMSILAESLAWIECKVIGEHATGDHVVVFGQVTAAELLREGEPSMHVRKNGLNY